MTAKILIKYCNKLLFSCIIFYKHKKSFLFVLGSVLLLVYSCDNDYQPKPRAYFRIDLPSVDYKIFDSIYPYSFKYPGYAKIVPDTSNLAEPFWLNIVFPKFKGTLHLSYKSIKNNLNTYSEDSRQFVLKHIPKADAIQEKPIFNKSRNLYGFIFNIEGNSAASTYQFFITDSTKHFLRGALYFNFLPNNDSLKPVLDFIKADIDSFIYSIKWKNIQTLK